MGKGQAGTELRGCMIYIFSDEHDFSTNEVIDWLIYYNYPFLRINQDDKEAIESLCTHLSTLSMQLEPGRETWHPGTSYSCER